MNLESLSNLGFGALVVMALWILAPLLRSLIEKIGRPPQDDKLGTVLLEMKNHMGVIENTLNTQTQTLAAMASIMAVIEDRTRN